MKKFILALVFSLLVIPGSTKALNVTATSSILMDIDSNRILYSNNIHSARSVASISKIMTAILAIESNKLDQVVKIDSTVLNSYGSGIYIKEGEQIKLADLVYGLMLRSGNDAALAIANYVSGSVEEFVLLMNNKAIELGMKNTIFNNPSGLDEDKGNYSTAYDMAILTCYAMKNDVYKKIVSTKRYKINTNMNYYDWTNKNKLLFEYKYATGGKTGYTKIAKRTLVTTASKDDLNLVSVTLNDGNDFSDHINMFEFGFGEYARHLILLEGNLDIVGENYYSNNSLYLKKSFYYPLSKAEESIIKIKYILNKEKKYKDGDSIGKVHVYMGDKEIYSDQIYVNITKERLNIIQKIIRWFKKIW